jgi:hypothetical protein
MIDLVGQSLNIQALQKQAIELWQADQASALELGKVLVALRAAMKNAHGDFTAWFREAGLSENRVYYCIRLVEGKIVKAKADASKTSPEEDEPWRAEQLFTAAEWVSLCKYSAARQTTPELLLKEIITEWCGSHPVEEVIE